MSTIMNIDILVGDNFNLVELEEIDPIDYIGFGTMSSHKYRKMFMDITKNLTPAARTWIFVWAVAIKSKPRILNAVEGLTKSPTMIEARDAIVNLFVQYTSEKTPDTFPIVNVPSCNPTLSSLIWIKISTPEKRNATEFLKNLWAAQINLAATTQSEQKAWEMSFWDNTVTKGSANKYEPGFHSAYYETKASDKYPLLNKDKTIVAMSASGYTKANLTAWIAANN